MLRRFVVPLVVGIVCFACSPAPMDHVDGGGVGAPGRVEQSDVTGRRRDRDLRAGAADRVDPALLDIALARAAGEQNENHH